VKLPALDLGHNVHDPQVQILRNLEVLAIIANLDIGRDIKVERVRSVPDEPKKEKVEEEPAKVTEVPPPPVSKESTPIRQKNQDMPDRVRALAVWKVVRNPTDS